MLTSADIDTAYRLEVENRPLLKRSITGHSVTFVGDESTWYLRLTLHGDSHTELHVHFEKPFRSLRNEVSDFLFAAESDYAMKLDEEHEQRPGQSP